MYKNFILAVASLFLWNGLRAQELALSTNFIDYADLATLNLEASLGVAQHWSVSAGVKYNPFTFNPDQDDALQKRQRQASAGVRYWPWHIFSGWWLSGALRWQEYNVGGISSRRTSEGDRVGGGFAGGYTYMIAPHLNLDLGVGAWAGYDNYTTYECQTCGRIVDQGGKYFFLPADLLLSLTYIF